MWLQMSSQKSISTVNNPVASRSWSRAPLVRAVGLIPVQFRCLLNGVHQGSCLQPGASVAAQGPRQTLCLESERSKF